MPERVISLVCLFFAPLLGVLAPESILPIGAVGPTLALAATACGGSKTLYTGWDASHTLGGYGATADIVTRQGYICTTTSKTGYWGNKVSAWALEWAPNALPSLSYAQVGYIKFNDGTNAQYLFAEWTDSSCSYQQSGGICMRAWGITSLGAVNTYVAYDNAQDQRMEMAINGGQVGKSSYVPNSANRWPGPWSSQYMAEVKDAGDDIPGSIAYRTEWMPAQYLPYYNNYDAYDLPSGSVSAWRDAPSLYCYEYLDGRTFAVWTCR